jgi:hypothetical protein
MKETMGPCLLPGLHLQELPSPSERRCSVDGRSPLAELGLGLDSQLGPSSCGSHSRGWNLILCSPEPSIPNISPSVLPPPPPTHVRCSGSPSSWPVAVSEARGPSRGQVYRMPVGCTWSSRLSERAGLLLSTVGHASGREHLRKGHGKQQAQLD